jgi:phytoene dehydrogenase-like protein
MRACVVGAGLGGLLSALGLLKKGYKVTIHEALSYPGGRFTNREYRGYQLSTGALHMIPHGSRGPLAGMLRDLGVEVEIVDSNPEGMFRVGGEDRLFEDLPGAFPLGDRVRLGAALAKLTLGLVRGEESFKSWLIKQIKHPLALRLADSFCGWALSLDSSQIPARELAAIAKNVNTLGGPGVPVGGCKGVTDALMKEIQGEGGKIIFKSRVRKIGVEKGRARYVLASDKIPCDMVVSDIGPKSTADLCGGDGFPMSYIARVSSITEASGIKISVACDGAVLGHTGVLFTPQAERVCGVNEVTNADPGLAPEGKHLLMSHQVLAPGRNLKEEISLGVRDLHALFPGFKERCRILAAQCYREKWPVNRAMSGQSLGPGTPVKGLVLVGDAVKPSGYMETEGIAAGVKLALDMIEVRGAL